MKKPRLGRQTGSRHDHVMKSFCSPFLCTILFGHAGVACTPEIVYCVALGRHGVQIGFFVQRLRGTLYTMGIVQIAYIEC